LILPAVSFAQLQYDGLVPICGTPSSPGGQCELCHVIELANNLIDFIIIYVSWPVAAVLFAYAGFTYMTSAGNPGGMGTAKTIFTNVAIGFIIVLAAWLVIDAIMGSLVGQNTLGQPWSRIQCVGPTGPAPGTGSTGGVSVVPAGCTCTTPGQATCNGYDPCDPAVQANIAFANQNPEGQSLRTSLGTGVCSTGQLAPVNAAVTQAVQGVSNTQIVTPSLVQAIILKESGGDPNPNTVIQPKSGAVGRMQVLPTTAQTVVPSLQGMSKAAVTTWLQDPTNNIKAGTLYFDSLITKYNGNVNLALAAYNGGPAANLTSVNCCVGVSNCQVTRWQCLYDNNAKTVLNTGYQETRNYVPWVTSRQTQIANGQCP
jgi:hypothetical protein